MKPQEASPHHHHHPHAPPHPPHPASSSTLKQLLVILKFHLVFKTPPEPEGLPHHPEAPALLNTRALKTDFLLCSRLLPFHFYSPTASIIAAVNA